MKTAKALTIAGSDSGGGAGIQADLKTFQELDVFGMSAITAVTAQNTTGVQAVYPMEAEAVEAQLQSIGSDLRPDAVKTGMLFSGEIIHSTAQMICRFNWDNLVIDPVMIAKGGASLLQEEAMRAMKKELIPLAKVVTPNIPEAEALIGLVISTLADRVEAAKRLFDLGAKNVVIKGGHAEIEAEVTDILYDGSNVYYFKGNRIDTKNTHGTGCTFAAALTAGLAKGMDVKAAVETAQKFVHAAIECDLEIGNGHGPTNHWAYQRMRRNKGRLANGQN